MPRGKRLVRQTQMLMTEVLGLPKDLIMDLPRVTMLGNIQLTIENHKGIITYTETDIRIAISKGELGISGQKLVLRTIVFDEIVVDGIITAVSYLV